MFDFKDFNITSTKKGYEGDKIKTERLIGREIKVYSFSMEDSIKIPGTKYLAMQIEIGDTKHVVFTTAKDLIEKIHQVPNFPFKTIIIKQNDYLKFT